MKYIIKWNKSNWSELEFWSFFVKGIPNSGKLSNLTLDVLELDWKGTC